MLIPQQIGLYIHLPWCVQKCPYCDFNSHPLRDSLPETEYVEALLADIRFEAPQWADRAISSIFFGGGTPSLFSGGAISQILENAAKYFRLADDIEITLEANPGTAEARHFQTYRGAGVNRLSLGLQSLDDRMLQRLDRIHCVEESLHAFDMAREAGFDNINIDIMYGLPQQNESQALNDLQQAIALQPEHLSWYQLTLEPNTAFAQSPPQLPDHDASFAIQGSGLELLKDSGFKRYEVSAYARAGKKCRHNLNYWQFGDYLGLGAGAHGKLTQQEVIRTARLKHPRDYLRTAGTLECLQDSHSVPADNLLFEYLLNQLRLVEGFTLPHMRAATDTGIETFKQQMQNAIDGGLLKIQDEHCQPTARGFTYLNEILLDILPEQGT